MIRPVTCVCMMLAAGSGLYLYQAKHRVQLLEQDIAKVMRSADANRDRMRVLRAEYQLLQDPGRMADLATQHLALAKTDPKQFVAWSAAERIFPVVTAPPPDLAAPPAEMDAPAAAPPTSAVMAAVSPSRPDPAPRPAVPLAPRPAPTVASPAPAWAALATPKPAVAPPSLMASATAPPRSSLGMVRGDAGQVPFQPGRGVAPVPQPIAMTTPRRPLPATPVAAAAESYPRFNRVGAYEPQLAPVSGSALGMARSLSSPSVTPTASWAGIGSGG